MVIGISQDLMIQLFKKGLSDYAGLMQAGPSDILSYNWNEAGNAFCNGQAAFFADASLFGPWFETDDCPISKGNTGYMALPPQKKEVLLTQQTGSGELEWVLMHKKKMQVGTLFNT